MISIEDPNFTRFDLQELMDYHTPCTTCGDLKGGPYHCCLCLGNHEEFAICQIKSQTVQENKNKIDWWALGISKKGNS